MKAINLRKISVRKDGRFSATLKLPDGKRKHVYGKTEQEVRRKLRALTKPTKKVITSERRTVAQFLNRWLEETVPLRTKPQTGDGYYNMVQRHITPHIGNIELAELTPQHVQTMINKLAKKMAPNSVRNIRGCLRGALNHAMRWDYVTRNVAKLVDVPRIKKYHVHVLTPEQAQQFLDSIDDHHLRLFYYMAILLGLRRGELLALQWENIDLERGRVHVVATLLRRKGKLQRSDPKTDASNSTVPLPPFLIEQLSKHQQPSGYVFSSGKDTPIDPWELHRQYKKLLVNAGLPANLRIHDLRHSCATFLLESGASLQAVKEHLRHTDISVTSNYYGHLLDTERRRVATGLETFLLKKETHD